MEGDEIMVDIYESVQDELRMKNKQLEKEKRKVVFKITHCTVWFLYWLTYELRVAWKLIVTWY